jgi:hypothetical protein
MPIRYADDFTVLISTPPDEEGNDQGRRIAEEEKAALAEMLKRELGLNLSENKTLITPVTQTRL